MIYREYLELEYNSLRRGIEETFEKPYTPRDLSKMTVKQLESEVCSLQFMLWDAAQSIMNDDTDWEDIPF